MKFKEIKVRNQNSSYSIIIGVNILGILSKKIKSICPEAKKIGVIIDSKVPKYLKSKILKILKGYKLFVFEYSTSENLKSFKNANMLAEKCLKNKFNRSDILIAVGGGVIGDFTGFVSSIVKRGLNFINIPTTLLAQVDSSVGGKTGVNSQYGKNLVGTFYQPKLVISDAIFLKSLPKREVVCGYAEVLKHSLILENNFFKWIQKNSKKILENKDLNFANEAIYKSCKIKLFFVNKDVSEKNSRMILNFGHTFAHAIESKNKFSNKINHGEAVLIGMMMATKLSKLLGVTSKKTLDLVKNVYSNNNINYDISNYFSDKDLPRLANFMLNDKKNNDFKISLILLKRIGKTTAPGKFKITLNRMQKLIPKII